MVKMKTKDNNNCFNNVVSLISIARDNFGCPCSVSKSISYLKFISF